MAAENSMSSPIDGQLDDQAPAKPDRTELYTPSLWRKRLYDGPLSLHTYLLNTTAVYQCAKDWLKELLGRKK